MSSSCPSCGAELATPLACSSCNALIEAERITSMGGVPVMSRELLAHPDFARRDTSSLVALGGGVVGDLAGFIASNELGSSKRSYMLGISGLAGVFACLVGVAHLLHHRSRAAVDQLDRHHLLVDRPGLADVAVIEPDEVGAFPLQGGEQHLDAQPRQVRMRVQPVVRQQVEVERVDLDRELVAGRILDADPGAGGFHDLFALLAAIMVVGILLVGWLAWLKRKESAAANLAP